jgi:hypothetical protein
MKGAPLDYLPPSGFEFFTLTFSSFSLACLLWKESCALSFAA